MRVVRKVGSVDVVMRSFLQEKEEEEENILDQELFDTVPFEMFEG